ncbi:hypothetical protein NHP194003_10510 [Helicobacter suis]|uniref:phage portal protein family protein n=1 Tax=Helicobacter suis TaxID=104628 RepID=UPI00159A2B69|nr:hypothetical protein NHP194003_10510 [Helicobacter suis]
MLDNLEDLRAASIGIFSKDDVLELLSGNVDQGAFLEFLRYCDECISKVISGQVLASNAVNKGTQALGNVHENTTRYLLEFDSKMLLEGINEALKEAFSLYFDSVPDFSLSLDTNTEIDEARQVQVYKALYDMGLEVDLSALQKAFKVPLTRIEAPLNGQSMQVNTQTNTIEKTSTGELSALDLGVNEAEISELLDQIGAAL